jgi:hypothetical protein
MREMGKMGEMGRGLNVKMPIICRGGFRDKIRKPTSNQTTKPARIPT